MMFVVGQLSTPSVQPKYLIATGAAIVAVLDVLADHCDADAGFWFFANARMLIGIGLPLIFMPIIAASYDGLEPGQTDMASALLNAARNTGGSIGVSLASNVLADRRAVPPACWRRSPRPRRVPYQEHARPGDALLHEPMARSAGRGEQQAFAWIGQQVQAQASLLAFIDVFYVLMLLALASIPLALVLRNVKLGGAAPAGH